MTSAVLLSGLVTLLSVAGTASAAGVYTSRAEWEAAAQGFVTDGFESYGVQQTSGGSIVFGAFDFVVPFNHEEIGPAGRVRNPIAAMANRSLSVLSLKWYRAHRSQRSC
jgi:hypothetical protein